MDDHQLTESCPFCLSEVPTGATRCRACTGDLAIPVEAPDLAGFWIGGILLALIGLAILASSGNEGGGSFFGILSLGIGGVLLQIAVIASGVSIGMRTRDEKTYVKRHTNAKAVSSE